MRGDAASPPGGEAGLYDGVRSAALATRLGVARVVAFAETASTLDVAHRLGEQGAASGTLVLADRQTAGRGRFGRPWESPAGAGIWLTLVEREVDAEAIGVLAIRLGLAAAPVLERFAGRPVGLKWPNDLLCDGGKLAGILCEARWHGSRLAWVAVGMGVNVARAGHPGGAILGPQVSRVAVLEDLVPALRAAAAARGELTPGELAAYAGRDVAAGRRCDAPAAGTVRGIAADGALLVATADGAVRGVHGGSLTFTAG